MTDPADIPRANIFAIIVHIRDRQMTFGYSQAFRWKKYCDHHSHLHDALYRVAGNPDASKVKNTLRKEKRDAKRQLKDAISPPSDGDAQWDSPPHMQEEDDKGRASSPMSPEKGREDIPLAGSSSEDLPIRVGVSSPK